MNAAPALKVHLTIFGNKTWWGTKTTEMTICAPPGTRVHELKGQVAEAKGVPVQDQKWLFSGLEVHDQEVMWPLDGHGPIRPWFMCTSKGKTVTMQLPQSWNHKLVLAMGTHSRSLSFIKTLPGDVLKKICVLLKSLLQPHVLHEGSDMEEEEGKTHRRGGNVPYHSSAHHYHHFYFPIPARGSLPPLPPSLRLGSESLPSLPSARRGTSRVSKYLAAVCPQARSPATSHRKTPPPLPPPAAAAAAVSLTRNTPPPPPPLCLSLVSLPLPPSCSCHSPISELLLSFGVCLPSLRLPPSHIIIMMV